MSKKKMLASIIAMIIGMPFAAHSASGISEKAACKEATAYFNKMGYRQKYEMDPSAYCHMGTKISNQTCANFESNTAQGWAKISVAFTRNDCFQNGKPENRSEPFTFQRLDQGWKVMPN